MTEDREAYRGPCPRYLPLALLLMPYALIRYAIDCLRGRP